MIIVVPIAPENKYGKYFLASEAPGDGPGPGNVRVVSVPQNNRSKDFTAGAEVNDDDLVDDSMPDDGGGDYASPDDGGAGDDTTDFTATGDTGADPAAPVDDGTGQDFTAGADGGDPNAGADPNAQGDIPPDGDFAGDDNTDFTGGAEDGGDPNAVPADQGAVPAAPQQQSGVGIDQDSTRNYKLYLEYIALYNSVDNYVSTLERIIKDEPEDNRIINYCTRTFRSIVDLIYDYVTIKFTENNYIQNLLFYEKLIAVTQLVLKILGKLRKTEK